MRLYARHAWSPLAQRSIEIVVAVAAADVDGDDDDVKRPNNKDENNQ